MQSGNLYVYGVNNPIYYIDETGELTWPGEIYNQVVIHMALKHGLFAEQKILYNIGYGRADLISPNGEVWEVKRDNAVQIDRGEKQVKKYVNNTWKNNPDPEKVSLTIGGATANSILIGDSFIYETELATYYVTYHYAGNGVIAYDYDVITNWVKVGEIALGIVTICGVAYLIVVTGGAAAPILTII